MARRIDIQVKARDDASAQLERIGGGVDRLVGKLDNLRNIAIAGVGITQLVGYLQGSLKAFSEQEQAVNRLDRALGMLGKNTPTAMRGMVEFSRAISELTSVGDEAALQVMALGAAVGHMSDDTLKKATVAAVGLSKAYGVDLNEAMRLIIDASRGQVGGLQRLGIEVNKNASAQEKFNIAMDAGVKNFAAAQGELTEYEAKMRQLNERLNDTREELGSKLAPVLIKVADLMLDYGIPAMEQYQLVWQLAGATAEAEALKIRDIVNHVFKDEAPAAIQNFAETAKRALADAFKVDIPQVLGGAPSSQPAGGDGFRLFEGQINSPSMPAGIIPRMFRGARDGYDPTGGRPGFFSQVGMALGALGEGDFGKLYAMTKSDYNRNKRVVNAAFGNRAGWLYQGSARFGLTGGLMALLSAGSPVAAGLGLAGTLGAMAIDDTGAPAGTGTGVTVGTSAGTRSGFTAATTGGFFRLLRSAITGTGGPPPVAGALARGLGWGSLVCGLVGTGVGMGMNYLDAHAGATANNLPFVPPTGELAAMRSALVGMPVAGILPEQWSSDTLSAISRRDALAGRLSGFMGQSRRDWREQRLAEIMQAQHQFPGMGGTSGAWMGPVAGREFRFGGGNAGIRSAAGPEPVQEMVSWQRRMADIQQQQHREYIKAERRKEFDRRNGLYQPGYNYVRQAPRLM